MIVRARMGSPLHGSVRLPGDKSVSHRASLLAGMAGGTSRIDGMLQAGVTRAMLDSLAALGIEWRWEGETLVVMGAGRRGFPKPDSHKTVGAGLVPALHCGNSATTIRLLAGALAGKPRWSGASKGESYVLDGSSQLRKRPMKRIIEPLREMGAEIRSDGDRNFAPIIIKSTALKGIDHRTPVASAQVKTCILLAGLNASGSTSVEEPSPSRDHTERLLKWLGVRTEVGPNRVRVHPLDAPLPPLALRVPGDFSSAAFLLVAASIVPGSDVLLRGVGLNPRRTGLLSVLRRMGARIEEVGRSESSGEPVGDLRVVSAPLAGTAVDGAEVVDMIDEFPVLAVAAACAEGATVVRGASELRHKESDRISVLAAELRGIGAAVEETADGFSICGGGALRGGRGDAHGDHRLAMSLAVAGLASKDGVEVDGAECIAESFPDFLPLLGSLGASIG
jgi:3-phosphoshikimate 1-carboxyvinyltransferase